MTQIPDHRLVALIRLAWAVIGSVCAATVTLLVLSFRVGAAVETAASKEHVADVVEVHSRLPGHPGAMTRLERLTAQVEELQRLQTAMDRRMDRIDARIKESKQP